MIRLRQIGLPASNLTKSANYLKMPISIKEIQLPSLISDSTPVVALDLIDLEKASDAIRQPENSVSITDFEAVANDGSDDYQAFMVAIEFPQKRLKILFTF